MGGAIFNMQGEVTIRASTLTENSAVGGADNVPDNQLDPAQGLGGGVLNLSGTLEVVGSTLSGNTVSTKGSSIYNVVLDAVTERRALTTLRSTIVADETGPIDLVSSRPVGTPEGPLNLGSATAVVTDRNIVRTSLAEEDGTITGSPSNANPLLEALAANGGPTRTLAPAMGSPAIDAGSAFGLVTDQRGLPRPSDFTAIANAGDGSDIGAVELQAPGQPGGNGQPPPPNRQPRVRQVQGARPLDDRPQAAGRATARGVEGRDPVHEEAREVPLQEPHAHVRRGEGAGALRGALQAPEAAAADGHHGQGHEGRNRWAAGQVHDPSRQAAATGGPVPAARRRQAVGLLRRLGLSRPVPRGSREPCAGAVEEDGART